MPRRINASELYTSTIKIRIGNALRARKRLRGRVNRVRKCSIIDSGLPMMAESFSRCFENCEYVSTRRIITTKGPSNAIENHSKR